NAATTTTTTATPTTNTTTTTTTMTTTTTPTIVNKNRLDKQHHTSPSSPPSVSQFNLVSVRLDRLSTHSPPLTPFTTLIRNPTSGGAIYHPSDFQHKGVGVDPA